MFNKKEKFKKEDESYVWFLKMLRESTRERK